MNLEIGKQFSGFEPHAIEQLQNYTWPNNYTQFRQVLTEFATLSDSDYIRSNLVADILAKERSLNRRDSVVLGDHTTQARTLSEILSEAVQQALVDHDGNQTAAAKQLGISRTTLWRHLNQ